MVEKTKEPKAAKPPHSPRKVKGSFIDLNPTTVPKLREEVLLEAMARRERPALKRKGRDRVNKKHPRETD